MFRFFKRKDETISEEDFDPKLVKYIKEEYEWELDLEKMVEHSTFVITPENLIKRCKEVLDNDVGLKNEDDLAEDFQFIFPVVGPLSKKEYLETLKEFDLQKMFPTMKHGIYYNFYVDPYEHNRVWFTARLIVRNTGDGFFGKATNKLVNCPPQSISLKFNKRGKVIQYTGGYVMDKTIGNTGGLGGVFGMLYAIGRPLPFPEAQPYKKSFQFSMFSSIKNFFS